MAYARKRVYRKRRGPKRAYRKRQGRKSGTPLNTASLREVYQVPCNDGVIVFNRGIELATPTFDRAQTVAQAYQEFCIKHVRLTFRPSADTFAPAAGNSIPQLYYVQDRAGTVPPTANLQTLLDMGIRPQRFDSKNIVKTYKPAALLGADIAGFALSAGMMKISPWLSTSANAGNPGTWAPSMIEHGGAAFFVSKMSGLTPTLPYIVEVEVLFNFRKPLWRTGSSEEVNHNQLMSGSNLVPIA